MSIAHHVCERPLRSRLGASWRHRSRRGAFVAPPPISFRFASCSPFGAMSGDKANSGNKSTANGDKANSGNKGTSQSDVLKNNRLSGKAWEDHVGSKLRVSFER